VDSRRLINAVGTRAAGDYSTASFEFSQTFRSVSVSRFFFNKSQKENERKSIIKSLITSTARDNFNELELRLLVRALF